MKRILALLLTVFLALQCCLPALAEEAAAPAETAPAETAPAETAPTEAPAVETPAAEMTAEELNQAGIDAEDAGDYAKALEYYRLAADAGNPAGWRNLGLMYVYGMGVEPDYDLAMEYFQLAAAQGDGISANSIGVLHQLGLGAEQDLGKAMEYYEKAGDLGYSGGYKTLAVMYDLGSEVEPDPAKAAEFYLKAADLGDADACCQIAAMYAGGSGVEQDAGKAAEYYQKAADLGMVQALYTLGMMYYTGDGAEQDFAKAVTYFTQAAEQEDPTAMFALGECLRRGLGTEKDPGKAAEWYRKALEDGYAPNEEEKEMLKAALGEAYDLFFPVPEEGKDYFVRTATVLTGEEQVGSMDLRFYLSAPHVPCYGLKDYVNFMYQTGLTVTPPQDGTVWEVANPNGTKILVDPSAGKIEAADWARFQMPPTPYTTLVGVKDTPCAWTYYSEIGFDDPPAPVTFDFAKYGIAVYADEEDVYLPLELLSAMFTDIACNYVLWNGETVLKPKMDTETFGTVPVEWYESKYMIGLLTGKRQREEDVIREDYAELCFTLDYLYGHPGPALLESGLSEKGLDAALDDIPELSSVKERLMSPDMVEYMLALNDLFNIGLNEGHCMYLGLNGVSEADFPLPELAKKLAGRSQSNFQLKSIGLMQVDAEVRKARQAAWGDEVYRECGSTAILRIDAFQNDTAGWEAYYAGKGEIPMDAVGITWTGLKRASENPAIKNILFDLSANSGGSNDMLMYMMDLMFGEKNFSGYNVLTKQREHAVVRSDKNLDGVFDEKDEEVKYDFFNYAVLTARGSFSCGNLFPFVMQEHGAVLLGEPTGGGSCAVQMVTLTNGGEGMMSSWLWALRDENGESVEGGCKTDLPIARIEPETPTNEDPRLSAGDYTPFFDDVMLDRMINEWFEEQVLSPAAQMTPEELYATAKAALDEGDFAKAMEYYQQAADAGNPEGLRGLGALYANGVGVDPDYDRAMEYFQQAADLGDAKSFASIAIFYQYGLSVEQDAGKAMENYEKAGDLGYSDGYKTLAAMYAYGSGMEPDPVKALEYYQKAADMGDADACCQVAAMYAAGSGVPQDAGKALEYWQKAADLGMVQVFGTLGLMYYTGEGTQQDYDKAVTYLTQAAEQEEPTAMFVLGECLRLGQGTEKDPGKAAEWYRKALEDGYEPDEKEKEMLKAALGDEYDLFFPAPEEGKDYFVRTVGVLTEKEQVGSMDLRFWLSAPHVPYYGLKAYVNFMYQTGLTVTPPEDGSVWEVSNPNGTKILVDPSAGKIEAADWARFQVPPTPYTTQVGVKDTPCGWTYYSEIGFDDPPAPVTFDFAKYGISVYADEEDVYLPLELLSAMFTDIACNYVLWNGESVLKPVLTMEAMTTIPVEWYESKYMSSLLTGKRQRAEDVIREDYAELCFTLDYLYGHPGPALLESGLSEKGLDAALDDIPELSSVKERLMNPDMVEYMLALNDLFNIGLNEGHCMYFGLNAFVNQNFPFPELVNKITGRIESSYQIKAAALHKITVEIEKTRKAVWGDEVYRECGSTAILRIDKFYNDTAGWEAFYAGKGDIPMDAVGITWTGLKRASENPAIRNILFDLSANGGGSSDMLMYMMDLMFGENIFRGYNVLTKQHEHAVVHSDKNLDGVFDEKDEEVKYDFNYAVLTTRAAFSCGNLMPFMMQEHGAVLLGEPTGGGSCCVQLMTLTSGGSGMMSSWLWALRDENGESVEGGCKTDLPIARIEPETPTNEDPRLSNGDYSPYFDDVMLDRMINEWFEEQALAPAA